MTYSWYTFIQLEYPSCLAGPILWTHVYLSLLFSPRCMATFSWGTAGKQPRDHCSRSAFPYLVLEMHACWWRGLKKNWLYLIWGRAMGKYLIVSAGHCEPWFFPWHCMQGYVYMLWNSNKLSIYNRCMVPFIMSR